MSSLSDLLDLFDEEEKKQEALPQQDYDVFRCIESGYYKIDGEIRELIKGQIIMPQRRLGKPVEVKRVYPRKKK